jgi:hypothetical protein
VENESRTNPVNASSSPSTISVINGSFSSSPQFRLPLGPVETELAAVYVEFLEIEPCEDVVSIGAGLESARAHHEGLGRSLSGEDEVLSFFLENIFVILGFGEWCVR